MIRGNKVAAAYDDRSSPPPISSASLAADQFADRCERKWQLAVAALGIAGFGLIFSQMTAAPGTHVGGRGGSLFCNTVLAYSLHAYQSELYPTRIRARAVGFTYGWSRFSTIFIGFIIAWCLRNYGTLGVFTFIAGSMIIVFFVIAIMGPRTTGRRLEADFAIENLLNAEAARKGREAVRTQRRQRQ